MSLPAEDSLEDISPSSEWPRRGTSSRRRPRSISGVDGPTSRLPSSSVASVKTTNIASRRSMKETFISAPVTPNTYIDPPRPAKEGHEWVWFPAGYWAERELVEAPRKVMRHFKWRKRSGKSSSRRDTQDDPEHSPNYLWDHWSRTPLALPSPFLTEEAHVQSLQRPPLDRQGTSSESGGSTFPLNRSLQTPLPSPYLTEEAHVQSLQRSPLSYQDDEYDTSLPQLVMPTQSSPLTETRGSDSATPTAASAEPTGTSFTSFFHLSPGSAEARHKKSFMSRLLPEHKSKMKKTHSDNDAAAAMAYDYTTNTIEGARVRLLSHSQSHSPVPIMSRVASLLRDEINKKPRSAGAGGSSSGNGGSGWSRSLKLFGKSPWHRKASAGSEASASSSVRDVLRGRTPVASPVSDIEPVNSFCVQFPGGEAKRIKTPPLREIGHHTKRPRSFFFDISTPSPRYKSGSISSGESSEGIGTPYRSPPPTANIVVEQDKTDEKKKRDSGKEWWDVPVAVPQYEAMGHRTFQFDMPEHLPSSPMCPANKKHKSGGTGVCVYHGRRKRSGDFASGDEVDDDDDFEDVWT
ncbi:hypothetical protein M426DRAFT_317290 [Hypoxylon sp. CI-4A]|nr:hypothetical protein M426DRAFT_317290 [Hypoxylon sp. CI-4A]